MMDGKYRFMVGQGCSCCDLFSDTFTYRDKLIGNADPSLDKWEIIDGSWHLENYDNPQDTDVGHARRLIWAPEYQHGISPDRWIHKWIPEGLVEYSAHVAWRTDDFVGLVFHTTHHIIAGQRVYLRMVRGGSVTSFSALVTEVDGRHVTVELLNPSDLANRLIQNPDPEGRGYGPTLHVRPTGTVHCTIVSLDPWVGDCPSGEYCPDLVTVELAAGHGAAVGEAVGLTQDGYSPYGTKLVAAVAEDRIVIGGVGIAGGYAEGAAEVYFPLFAPSTYVLNFPLRVPTDPGSYVGQTAAAGAKWNTHGMLRGTGTLSLKGGVRTVGRYGVLIALSADESDAVSRVKVHFVGTDADGYPCCVEWEKVPDGPGSLTRAWLVVNGERVGPPMNVPHGYLSFCVQENEDGELVVTFRTGTFYPHSLRQDAILPPATGTGLAIESNSEENAISSVEIVAAGGADCSPCGECTDCDTLVPWPYNPRDCEDCPAVHPSVHCGHWPKQISVVAVAANLDPISRRITLYSNGVNGWETADPDPPEYWTTAGHKTVISVTIDGDGTLQTNAGHTGRPSWGDPPWKWTQLNNLVLSTEPDEEGRVWHYRIRAENCQCDDCLDTLRCGNCSRVHPAVMRGHFPDCIRAEVSPSSGVGDNPSPECLCTPPFYLRSNGWNGWIKGVRRCAMELTYVQIVTDDSGDYFLQTSLGHEGRPVNPPPWRRSDLDGLVLKLPNPPVITTFFSPLYISGDYMCTLACNIGRTCEITIADDWEDCECEYSNLIPYEEKPDCAPRPCICGGDCMDTPEELLLTVSGLGGNNGNANDSYVVNANVYAPHTGVMFFNGPSYFHYLKYYVDAGETKMILAQVSFLTCWHGNLANGRHIWVCLQHPELRIAGKMFPTVMEVVIKRPPYTMHCPFDYSYSFSVTALSGPDGELEEYDVTVRVQSL